MPSSFLNKFKIIYLSMSLFCWIMYISFGSNTVSLMTNKKVKIPFTNIKNLIEETDYSILALNGPLVTTNFRVTIN